MSDTERRLRKMSVGDTRQLPDGSCFQKINDDAYAVQHYLSGHTHVVDMSAMIHAISSGKSPFGGLGGLTSIQWPPGPSMTPEESKELEELEKEAKAFIKQTKLNKFKAFPRHLRQEVVDDCYTRDLASDLGNTSEKDFPDAARLNNLRNKKNMHSHLGQIHVSSSSYFQYEHLVSGTYVSKYDSILKHFTTEELAKAHAEACLEEDINT